MLAAVPMIVHAMVAAQVLPAAALASRRVRPFPAKLVAGAYLFSLLTDLFGRYIGRTYGNNHWVSLIAAASFTAVLVWAYAEWQITPVERLAFRIAVVPFLAIFATLVFTVDGWTTFARYSYPFATLVTLGGALWTLLRRSYATASVPVLQTDWFPILVGAALNAAVIALTTPIGEVLMRYQRVDLLVRVWQLRAALVIVSILLIALGMLRGSPEPEPAAA